MKIVFISILAICALNVFSQKSGNPLQVEQYKLPNGLTVYLNEDHNQPNAFGAIVIRGGSERDPADATGIAHYFEHIMFKGTDSIGTTNYKNEKVFLDSIMAKYDELSKTKDAIARDKIQLKINDLSLKASEFAIPNEFNKILTSVGGTQVNAYTSEENIVYHNMFPGTQIEKWIEVYSHRFINPVFRLFQSELETVYEEKNISMDNFFGPLLETYNKYFYKNHPYGKNTVLGSIDHLKNPSLTKMMEYFNTLYVANNMALVLSGDFDIEKIKPLIEKKFGRWRSGNVPKLPDYTEPKFNGREGVSKRMSPIKIGIMGFRTIPETNPEAAALEVCNNLLSNESQTGFFDKLYMDNKVMGIGVAANNHIDNGSVMIYFLPKIFGQSLGKVEKMMLGEINKLKNGEFDDVQLTSIKLNLKQDQQKKMENIYSRTSYIINSFMNSEPWENFVNYSDKIEKITKQDVINVAKKYYGNDYLALYSKMGFPKKEKLKKPPYKPIIPKNAEAKSDFAKKIDNMKETEFKPRFIEFSYTLTKEQKDVSVSDLQDKIHLYYTANPINKLFSLTLQYGIGKIKNPLLEHASSFLNLIGTEKHSFAELKKELQKLGCTYNSYSSDDYITVYIEGLDENFEKSIQLINELLTQMKPDEKQLEKFIEQAKLDYQMNSKEPSTLGDALKEFAIYKNRSYFLNKLNLKEIKALKSEQLVNAYKEALKVETDIFYAGSIDEESVKKALKTNINFPTNPLKSESPTIRELEKFIENTVYFINEKKAIQSQIYLVVPGEKTDGADRIWNQPFNKYFGSGMSGLVFQEIREFRSFSYSTYGSFNIPAKPGFNGYFEGYMGTQADKTIEALKVYAGLLTNMPLKTDRIETIRKNVLQSINSDRGSFRWLAYPVSRWIKEGFTDDPRKKSLELYKTMTFEDIVKFYNKHIAGKPMVVTVVGDENQIDMKELAKFGKIIRVDKKEVIKL